ncbi:MAG: hypothetical protein DI539_28275, partial [Flavobacterium psychrophilum]
MDNPPKEKDTVLTDKALIFIAIGAFAFASWLFMGLRFARHDNYLDLSVNVKTAVNRLLENDRAEKSDSVQHKDSLINLLKKKLSPQTKAQLALLFKEHDSLRKRCFLDSLELSRMETSWNTVNDTIPPTFEKNIIFRSYQPKSQLQDFESYPIAFY